MTTVDVAGRSISAKDNPLRRWQPRAGQCFHLTLVSSVMLASSLSACDSRRLVAVDQGMAADQRQQVSDHAVTVDTLSTAKDQHLAVDQLEPADQSPTADAQSKCPAKPPSGFCVGLTEAGLACTYGETTCTCLPVCSGPQPPRFCS